MHTKSAEIPRPVRGEEDARADAVGQVGGLPVYAPGRAPEHLRTQTQLGRERLKPAPGQEPVAYLRMRMHGDVPLYDPAGAARMRPLSAAVRARRTCPECGQVRDRVVRDRCDVCRQKAAEAARRLRARTCQGCKTVRERPYPSHGLCQACRRARLAERRERDEAALLRAITCPGRGCETRTGTKAAYRRARKAGQYWDARWCGPCEERAREQREAAAREQAEWAEQRARERREEVKALRAWAVEVLADPTLVVLDTETTGLHEEARILEVSVLAGDGTVLLDTLLDPGEPIPDEATWVHGIVDGDVAGAPGFGEVLPALTRALDGRRCLIYQADYDTARLRHELTLHYAAAGHEDPAGAAGAWLDAMSFEDVMVPYSDWFGEWSDYWGGYRWQPLDGGHRALGDCRAVLGRLRAMTGEHSEG